MPELGEPLSKREQEILECVVSGAGNKQVAADLHISQNTVTVHLRNIYVKLGVSSRTEATTEAIRTGLVSVPGADENTAVADINAAPEIEEVPRITEPDEAAIPHSDNGQALAQPEAEDSSTAKRKRSVLIIGGVVMGFFLLVGLIVGVNYFMDSALTPTAGSIIFEEVKLEDNWVQSNPLPVTAAKAAVTSFGLDLYLMGGEQDGNVSDSVWLYDTAAFTWENKAQKPTAVSEATATQLGGVIFVPGGRTADGQPSNVFEVYSTANDAWGTASSLPEAIAGGLTLTDGSLIYFIGGTNVPDPLNTMYVYDPSADSWRPLASMNHARAFASGGVVGNNLYVVGGFDGQSELDICEVYDIVADSWDDCAPMLSARGGAGTAVLLNKLYIVGGGMDASNEVTFSEVYDPTNDEWSLVNTPILGDDTIWTHLGMTSVENRIYTLGGLRNNNTATSDNFAYAPLIFQTFIPAASSGSDQ